MCSKNVPCVFSATAMMTSQLKQPFCKATLQKIHCGYAQLTAHVLAPPMSGQPSPATHSSYITSNSSICVIVNQAEFGLWTADSMCSTITERIFKKFMCNMWNDYAMCKKLNLLQQHWRKLFVTVLALLRYKRNRIFSIWNYFAGKFSTLKIVNFCIYSVSTFVL